MLRGAFRSATVRKRTSAESFNVREHEGEECRLQIYIVGGMGVEQSRDSTSNRETRCLEPEATTREQSKFQ